MPRLSARAASAPLVATLALAAAAGPARAEHAGALAPPAPAAGAPDRTLSLGEIEAAVKPISAQLGRCYLDAAPDARGAGQMLVQLAIHRRGALDGVVVSTPGLPAATAHRIAGCVRAAVGALAFPARRAPTTAVVPYYFQRTAAPGAGPQPSCWSPRGCPGR